MQDGTVLPVQVDSQGRLVANLEGDPLKKTGDTMTGDLTVPNLIATGSVRGVIQQSISIETNSGTSIDFTNIPSWAKRVTLMVHDVRVSGTSPLLVQVGNGSIVTTGYFSAASLNYGANLTLPQDSRIGFLIFSNQPTDSVFGQLIINHMYENLWTGTGTFGVYNRIGVAGVGGRTPNLVGPLDRIRLTTVNGTDGFVAGQANISYEG